MKGCVFCSIISGEISSDIITQTDDLVVIKDINPKASIHYLIIPKQHIADLYVVSTADTQLLGKMLLTGQQLGRQLGQSQAFRLVINNGIGAGQSVFHMHMHFLSGRQLPVF